MQTVNIADAVNDCAYIVAFLSSAFGNFPQREEISLNLEERTGVALILDGVSQRLFASGDALADKKSEMEVY